MEINEIYLTDIMLDSLNENLGVYGNYEDIAEEIYDKVVNSKPRLMDKGVYQYNLLGIKLESDSFLSDLNIICFVNSTKTNLGSSFNVIDDSIHLTKDIKLKNVFFKIACKPSTDNIMVPDKNSFRNEFIHELHHAYRYFSILSKNNGAIPKSEEIKYQRIQDSNKVATKLKETPKSKITDFYDKLNYAVYISSDDEINAMATEVYEFIKSNKGITPYNFSKTYSSIPVYTQVQGIEWLLGEFDRLLSEKDEDFKCACMEIAKHVMKWNPKDEKHAAMLLRQYFAKKYEKMSHQFFKCAKSAFVNESRYTGFHLTERERRLNKLIENGLQFT